MMPAANAPPQRPRQRTSVMCGLAADFSAAAPDTNGAEATGAMEDSISAPAVAMPIVRLIRVDVLTAVLLLVKGLASITRASPARSRAGKAPDGGHTPIVCRESHGPEKLGAVQRTDVLTRLGLRYYQQIVAIAAAMLASGVNSLAIAPRRATRRADERSCAIL